MTYEMPIVGITTTLSNRTRRKFTEVAAQMERRLGYDYTLDTFNNQFRRPTTNTYYQLNEVMALIYAYKDGLPESQRIRASEAIQIFSETRMRYGDFEALADLFPPDEFKAAWKSILPANFNPDTPATELVFKPLYPEYFVGREEDVRRLKARLGVGGQAQALTVMRGWPGVGKTTLVNSLVHDKDLEANYPDGILWASVGRNANVIEVLRTWARRLGAAYIDQLNQIEEVVNSLNAILKTRNVLLVADDIWDTSDGYWFKRVAQNTAPLLITTRFTDIASSLAQEVYILETLSEKASMELFSIIAHSAVYRYPKEMRKLAITLEGLPLALRVAGSLIEKESEINLDALSLIKDLSESYELVKHIAPSDRFDEETGRSVTIELLFQRSVETLDEEGQLGFTYLGAFAPKPATFALSDILAIWEVDVKEATPILRSLIMRGLLEPLANSRFQMHYTLFMYADLLLDRLEGDESAPED